MVELENYIHGERIFWKGKPNKKVFILETIFNPFLPACLAWAALDYIALRFAIADADINPEIMLAVISFFLIHLTPVWIYLGSIFTAVRKYQNTSYVITERAIYISKGIFTYDIMSKSFQEISHINIHKGIFDQILGVGDVDMICDHTVNSSMEIMGITPHGHGHKHGPNPFSIKDIADYQEVFKIIKDLQTDIYADTMYPNAKRPETNPGYNTKYTRY